MANCPKCNGQISDTAKFCKHCGNKIEQKPAFVFCEECGAKIEANAPFCEECGAKTAVANDDPWANNDPWSTFADYKQPEKEIIEKIVEKSVVSEKTKIEEYIPDESEMDQYTERLSKKELDKLEGTDDRLYFVHRRDKRTEKQLHSDFADYFCKPMFQDYTISSKVSPAVFGESIKYCKEVNFLFKLGNKPVLAVHIAKYSTHTHSAVTNIKKACRRKGIKHLCFILGYPNKEHYVVRRVLEELGEISRLY